MENIQDYQYINFCGEKTDVKKVDSKIKILMEAADLLDRLCKTYPKLCHPVIQSAIHNTQEKLMPYYEELENQNSSDIYIEEVDDSCDFYIDEDDTSNDIYIEDAVDSNESFKLEKKKQRIIEYNVPFNNKSRENKSLEIDIEYSKFLKEQLKNGTIEDAMDAFEKVKKQPISYVQMLSLVGDGAYLISAQHECVAMLNKDMSFSHIAELWNQMGRPTPNGFRWTTQSVEKLYLIK